MSNTYDKWDIVRREAVIIADGPMQELKIAAYRVRDPDTNEYGMLNFHATFNNTVMAFMGEHSAKLFADFVLSTIAKNKE